MAPDGIGIPDAKESLRKGIISFWDSHAAFFREQVAVGLRTLIAL